MLTDSEKRDAWIKLAGWINRLDEQLEDLSDEQRWYLRDACIKQMPLVTNSGATITHVAEKYRTHIANMAAYEAVQILTAQGIPKMKAYDKAAKHFSVKTKRIRDGFAAAKMAVKGRPGTAEFYKDLDLPPSYLLSNPDPDY